MAILADMVSTQTMAQIEFIYANLEAGTFRKDMLEDWLNRHTTPFDPEL